LPPGAGHRYGPDDAPFNKFVDDVGCSVHVREASVEASEVDCVTRFVAVSRMWRAAKADQAASHAGRSGADVSVR
jgi:hypothetical protein